ncbi:MAG: hypothetical protein ACJA1A_002915 [Saprospiraceae bacterium]|jgi:hypothetical protein
MKLTLSQIVNELIIKLIPFDIGLRRRALADKYLSSLSIKGKNIRIKHDINIKRRTALILGDNIELTGKNNIDASAGLMIGDNCTIDKKTQINTKTETGYAPIVIGAGNHIISNVKPGSIVDSMIPVDGLSDYEGQLVFILSTGRSGSKSIAKLIDQHSDAECYHDSFAHLNTWSCNYLYNISTKEEIKKKLLSLYNSMSLGKKSVYGQSDQKIAPLVPILSEMFPSAKFIWLIRNPYDFINSAYARGWFDNSEFGYPQNDMEFLKKKVSPSVFDADHRCNGAKVGVFTNIEWQAMTAFERICWYWSYWNCLIEENIEMLPKSMSLKVKLEELENHKNKILDFVGLSPIAVKSETVNSAYYKKPDKSQWTDEMNIIFEKHCKSNMKKWGY